MSDPSDPTPEEVNRFWLEEAGEAAWYKPTPALDAAIRARFMAAWIDAPRLAAAWADTDAGALAALILTDQFPRNMFREDARAYATDPLARRLARAAIEAGRDLRVEGPARQFFYMPFMHAEDLADQRRGVALFAARLPGDNLRHARLHRDAIAAFGRFPWRNAALDRATTPDEQRLLDAGGYGALVRGAVTLAEDRGCD